MRVFLLNDALKALKVLICIHAQRNEDNLCTHTAHEMILHMGVGESWGIRISILSKNPGDWPVTYFSTKAVFANGTRIFRYFIWNKILIRWIFTFKCMYEVYFNWRENPLLPKVDKTINLQTLIVIESFNINHVNPEPSCCIRSDISVILKSVPATALHKGRNLRKQMKANCYIL